MKDNASLDSIFRPRSIAIVGASRKKGSIGRNIMRNLIEYEFNGPIFPVNPGAEVIHSIKCYPSIKDIPDNVDQAIIVVPKELAIRAAEECGEKGVKGIVVITAGFKEVGGDGIKLEEQLAEVIKKYNLRCVGPNCMGVINTDPEYSMDATFAPAFPHRGNIGFLSQSGALGAAILEHARDLNLGISQFISVGNKLDISGNDVIEYWAQDDKTQVILLYLESFGNPRKFTQLAREIVKKKPIIAVKSGRTWAGAKAASSHTGALAGLDVGSHALFEQCGVLRVNTVERLFDLAQAFSKQPLPRGKRTAILTNAGGPGIMATDAVVNVGLEMATFNSKTIAELRKFLSPEASFANPLDMIASAHEENYYKCLQLLLADDGVDAVIVIFVHPVHIDAKGIARSIIKASQAVNDKPVLCVFMGKKDEASGIEDLQTSGLPTYQFPESAAIALASMEKYYRIKTRPKGKVRTFDDVDYDAAKAIFDRALKAKHDRLTDLEVNKALAAYGIHMPRFTIVHSIEDAVRFTEQKNYPVVLKLSSPEIVHKSDVGGVIVDLRNEAELVRGYMRIQENLKKIKKPPENCDVMIQEMARGGKELIIGTSYDPSFGNLIMVGLGGVYVEILKDVNFRIYPITDLDAREMITGLKGYKLLEGVRGEKGIHLNAIIEILQRLSQLIGDFPCIKEMDMNPFMAFPEKEKCVALDARISLHESNSLAMLQSQREQKSKKGTKAAS
jgi:acetyltransferase